MEINLGLYKIFAAVVKSGNFSKAAVGLYITQPAVSQAIRQLENSLGVKLFVRNKRGVNLTQEGEMLYGYVQSALNLIEVGENKVERFKGLAEGELRIGASDTVSKWYLPPYLDRFHTRYPEISISVTNRTSLETLELLKSGRIDIGFVNLPLSENGVVFEECMTVHDVFVAGSKYENLQGRKVTFAELAANPLIMLERASNSRRWIDQYFLQHGITLAPQIEMGAHDLLAGYAGIGLGIACVIKEFSEKAIEEYGLFEIELEKEIPPRNIGVCYLEEIGLSASARIFLRMTKDEK